MMALPFVMASNNFFLVPQIVSDEKYFDVSIPEMLRIVRSPAGKFERTEEHTTIDEYGQEYRVIIRLNVNCQSQVPEGWTIALKLHKERIDGIDWEAGFYAVDGSRGRGWHRHQWNQRTQSAKHTKIPTADFDSVDGREAFLIRALSIMRIKVSARDYGDQLPITKDNPA
jgi:hypothetical protein